MSDILALISEYQNLLKNYQKSKVADLPADIHDGFKECRESFKIFTDSIVIGSGVEFGPICYGKWQYGFGISSYLWNRFSAKHQSKSTLLVTTVLNNEGLIFKIDFNRKGMLQLEKVIEAKINSFINARINAISNELKNHFSTIKSNKILGFIFIEQDDVPNSVFSSLLEKLSAICDECIEKFYANQNEIDFCEWFISVEGLKLKTLNTYHDALARILPELIHTHLYFEKTQHIKNSIFSFQSAADVKSLIIEVKAKGSEELTEDNYKHLLQALNKYSKFLSDKNSKFSGDKSKATNNNMKNPLNQILFGPPGTGKTHNTVRQAVEIIDPDFAKGKDWNELKEKYDELMKQGQIVFTTFHQSMAYEDFVEGLKPISENGQVVYDVLPGIFKKLCTKASSKETNNFSEAFKSFTNSIIETNDELFELKTKTGKPFWVGVNSNENLVLFTTENKNRQGVLTLEKLNYHSINGDSFRGWEGYANAVVNELKSNHGLVNKKIDSSGKNFVLIIDEINRGNVSAIFGELITLIEASKRAGDGQEEALEITLPYSKEQFSVPKNLYLIGTMNTADRSVEALDSALRRRFSFTEMPPKPELIETVGNKVRYIESHGVNIDLVNLLNVMNDRIEVLLDKDHLIGHSYFMKVTDLDGLQDAFYNEIIPLLQEYFFGDYGKIAMVLGEKFCGIKEVKKKIEFANVPDAYDKPDYDDKLIFEIKNVEGEKFINAINHLLLKPSED